MILIAVACICAALRQQSQSNLQGANTALQAVAEGRLTTFERANGQFRRFRSTSRSMGAVGAARQWLNLFDEWERATTADDTFDMYRRRPDLSLREPVYAIPSPETWPLILNGLHAGKQTDYRTILSIYFELLLDHKSEALGEIEAIRGKLTGGNQSYVLDTLDRIELPLALDTKEDAIVERCLTRPPDRGASVRNVAVPDLVRFLGGDSPARILTRMLESPSLNAWRIDGDETRKLARSIALSDIDRIPTGRWNLAAGSNDSEFFAQQVAKYGVDALFSDQGTDTARSVYIASQLREGKAERVEWLLRREPDFSLEFDTPGLSRHTLFPILERVTDSLASTFLWREYFATAEALGRLPEAGKHISVFASSPQSQPILQSDLRLMLADIAARQGDVRAAFAEIQKAESPGGEAVTEKLFDLAAATRDAGLIDDTVKLSAGMSGERLVDPLLLDLLKEEGRLSDAERLAVLWGADSKRLMSMMQSGVALELVDVYYRANRPKDVIALLDGFSAWPSDDLSKIVWLRLPGGAMGNSRVGEPIGFYAAWAFAKTGQRALAIRTLHSLIQTVGDRDKAYELLNQVEGSPALAFYDGLLRLNSLDSWALIWRADLLTRMGRFVEGESNLHEALAADASSEFRRAAYPILAEILAKEGKAAAARDARLTSESLRIAAYGDRYLRAGLYPQAATDYRHASQIWGREYSIHMRLGRCLFLAGDPQGAREEYRRAYQLAPTSFDEIDEESLDCMGDPDRPARLRVGQEILERMEAKSPGAAGVEYALGRVYRDEGDETRADACFERELSSNPVDIRALRALDPAWRETALPPGRARQIATRAIQLDPSGSDVYGDTFIRLLGFESIWREYASIHGPWPEIDTRPLYRLNTEDYRSTPRVVAPKAMSAIIRDGPSAVIAHLPPFRDLLAIRYGY